MKTTGKKNVVFKRKKMKEERPVIDVTQSAGRKK